MSRVCKSGKSGQKYKQIVKSSGKKKLYPIKTSVNLYVLLHSFIFDSFTVCVCEFFMWQIHSKSDIKAALKWWYEINYYRVVMGFVVAITNVLIAIICCCLFSISACLFSYIFFCVAGYQSFNDRHHRNV